MYGELSNHLHLEHVKGAVSALEKNMFPFSEGEKEFVKYTVDNANLVVSRMNEITPNPEQGRKGGVLLIQKEHVDGKGEIGNGFVAMKIIGEDKGGNPIASEEIDKSNSDKHALYAIGKAMVLVNNPELLGSAQNKDLPSDEQQHITLRGRDVPGGAIRVKGIIYSFSGYSTPEEDECIILATLEERGVIGRDEALAYADQLGNAKYIELVDRLVTGPDTDSQKKIVDALTRTTTRDEFETLVDHLVTEDDTRLFGDKARDFIIQALLYPAVFAPAPATFDSVAYAAVIDDVVADGGYANMDRTVDPERIARLLAISLDNGIVEMQESGRVSMRPAVQELLMNILEQYE